jgi:hypothetical protein
MRSSADPAHVVLNMAFTPEDEPCIRLLIAFTCLLLLKEALLVKESSKDRVEPVKHGANSFFQRYFTLRDTQPYMLP